jgi:hypothetical protein
MDAEPHDRRPTQDILVKEEPREGNGDGVSAVWLPSSHTAAHQHCRHAGWHATTTDAPTRVRTSTPTPTLTLHRSSSGHRRILPLRPCCCAAARGSDLRVRQQLKALLEAAAAVQQAESSASHQRSERRRAGASSAHGPNPPPSQHQERGEGGGAAASAVRSRLGPNCDVRNTIEA